jgi:glucose-6-phosphate isomerase, archaeal
MPMMPFSTFLDFKKGDFIPSDRTNVRKLSHMKGMYLDAEAETERIGREDPVIYSFGERVLPEENGHLQLASTVIYPGKVGEEYFMTKGHYHRRPDTSEVYLGLEGEGILLMQTVDGDFSSLVIKPGTVAYIPPFWGHRMVNTERVPFVFFAVYPGDSGHNYGDIEKTGFVKCLVEQDGQPFLIDNPGWGRRA